MAKLDSGLLGPVRGKVGPVVGSSWMGVSYIKAAGKKRTEKRGKSESHNQGNFALLHRWLHPLLPFVKEGFRGYAPRVVGFNAAKSFGLKNAFTGAPDAKIFDPAKMQVSYGDLPLPGHMHFEKKADQLHFYWDTQLPLGASPYDQAMLLIYNSEKLNARWQLTGQFRSVGEDSLPLPALEGPCHVYMAFTAHDRSRQSHSVYLGVVE